MVDDLFLFYEASLEQVEALNTCLDIFCDAFDQKVNKDKTRVFFLGNVNYNRSREFGEYLGFQQSFDLDKNLGVPLLHKKVSELTYGYVVDKVQERISSQSNKA